MYYTDKKACNMASLDLDQLISNVRAWANEHPDRTYVSPTKGACFYSPDDNNPYGCIIGAAARDMDESFDELDAGHQTPGISTILQDHYGFHNTADTRIKWLEAVQDQQDGNYSWGAAVEAADADWNVTV